MARIYGPRTTDRRGGNDRLQLPRPGRDARSIATRRRSWLNRRLGISLRTGCFCNPGAGEVALGLTQERLASCFREKERMTYEQFLEVSDGAKTGALRVSVGLATTFGDAYQFIQVARTFIDTTL